MRPPRSVGALGGHGLGAWEPCFGAIWEVQGPACGPLPADLLGLRAHAALDAPAAQRLLTLGPNTRFLKPYPVRSRNMHAPVSSQCQHTPIEWPWPRP